jgi:hypothetical protein
MPVELDILDDGHILRYTIIDPWTYADFERIMALETAHRDSVNHTVHNLAVAKMRTVPPGVLRARNIPTFNHPTAGHIALVGQSQIVRLFAETVLKLARYDRARFFDTEEDALAFLRDLIGKEHSLP